MGRAISRDAGLHHADEGDKHGKRYGDRDNQTRSEAAKQEQKYSNDQQTTLNQVTRDGMNCALNKTVRS